MGISPEFLKRGLGAVFSSFCPSLAQGHSSEKAVSKMFSKLKDGGVSQFYHGNQ